MSITAIETIRTDTHDNVVWVHIETDSGLIGLGETFFGPSVVEAQIHDVIAPRLLGGDETRISHWHATFTTGPVGYSGSGAEMRAASAIDIALWDIAGKRAGRPLHELLGGLVRDGVAVYNTCAGPHYATRTKDERDVARWFGVDHAGRVQLDDLKGWMETPEALARDLLAEGILGMKIWPFDTAAYANGGVAVTTAQIEQGLAPLKRIREAVGRDIDVMLDLHCLWDVDSASRIIRAAEPFEPAWIEDPIRMDDIAGLARLAAETRLPIYGSETTAGPLAFRQLLEARALDIVSFDPGWSGGITGCRTIADLAAAYGVPIAPHDCTGPVGYVAGATLALTRRNARVMETVRAYTRGWYRDVATVLPAVENGNLLPMPGHGLGISLRPDFLGASTTHVRRSAVNRPIHLRRSQ